MNRRKQFLLFLLDVLLCGLIEQLYTLLHLLQFLLTDLLDSVRHRSLLRLIVLVLLLDLFVHGSQLRLILGVDGVHLKFNLRHLRHLREQFLRVDVTEFLCAESHRSNQQKGNNKLFHCCIVILISFRGLVIT